VNISGNEIVFQVTFTPDKPANYLKGAKLERHVKQRQFYTCNQEEDYLHYTSRGATKDILTYAGDLRKSCGIFGQKGELSRKELVEVRRKLRQTQSILWHGFISFEAEFGMKHCGNLQSAMTFMRRNFVSRFLSKTHLNQDNVTWLASLHEDTDHYHIHFMFFENEPKRYPDKGGKPHFTGKGNIKQSVLKNAKADFYGYFLTKECGIHHLRDSLLNEFKEKYLAESKITVSPRLLRELIILSSKLPADGSLKYGSDNMAELRPEIDSIARSIIAGDRSLGRKYKDICSLLSGRDKAIRQYGEQTGTDTKEMLLWEKTRRDLFARIGSQVIDAALHIRSIRAKPIQTQMPRYVEKRLRRSRKKSVLREYTYLLHRVGNSVTRIFEEYLDNLARIEREQAEEALRHIDRG
jgi:hypothetical protein